MAKKKWIKGAKLKEGAFTKKAEAAGKSVAAFAEEKKDAPGRTGRQARLAQTFERMRGRAKGEKSPLHDRSR